MIASNPLVKKLVSICPVALFILLMHLVTGEVTNRWGSGPFNSIIVRAGSDPFIPTSRSPYSRGGLWDPWNHVSSLLHPESLEVSRSFPTVQLFAKITGSFEEELKNHYG